MVAPTLITTCEDGEVSAAGFLAGLDVAAAAAGTAGLDVAAFSTSIVTNRRICGMETTSSLIMSGCIAVSLARIADGFPGFAFIRSVMLTFKAFFSSPFPVLYSIPSVGGLNFAPTRAAFNLLVIFDMANMAVLNLLSSVAMTRRHATFRAVDIRRY